MQAEDLLDLILVAGVVALMILAMPITMFIHDKLYERRLRRHFSDTRGRRRTA